MKKGLIFINWLHLDLSNHHAVHAWQQFLVVQKLFRTDSNKGTEKEQTVQLVALKFQNYLP